MKPDFKAKFTERMASARNRMSKKMGGQQLRCNICDRMFRATSGFHRFCRTCKLEDELFRFSEWLPESGFA